MRNKNTGLLPVVGHDKLYGVITDRYIAIHFIAEGLDFTQTTVEKVMTVGAVCCEESTQLKGIAKLMRDKGLRRVIVNDPLSGSFRSRVALQTRAGEHNGGESENLEN
jgi:CBS domain-containing protein